MSTHTRTWRIEGGRLPTDKMNAAHDFINRPGFVKTVKVEVDRISVGYDDSQMAADRGKIVADTVARAVAAAGVTGLKVVELKDE